MPSSRRSYLRTIGAVTLPLGAGCVGGDAKPLAVETVAPRQSFEWRMASVHEKGYTATDGQFVFVHIPEDAGVPSHSDVSLVVGDERYESGEQVGSVDRDAIRWVRSKADGVQPVFELPLDVAADTLAIRTADGAEYTIEEETRDRIRNPPKLSVDGFEVGERDRETGDLRMMVSIGNAGGHAGTFRATLGSTALSGQPLVSIDAAPKNQTGREFEVNRFAQEGTETFRLDWGADSMERDVEVD